MMLTQLSVSTSCGFAVPYFSYEGERLELDTYYTKLQESSKPDANTGLAQKLLEYWSKKNSLSIDTMPGLRLGSDLSIALKPPFETYGSYRDGKVVSPGTLGQSSSVLQRQASTDIRVLLGLAFAFAAGVIFSPHMHSILHTVRATY